MAEYRIRARCRSHRTNPTSATTPTAATTGVAEIGAVDGHVAPNTWRSAMGFHQPMVWPSMSAKINAPKRTDCAQQQTNHVESGHGDLRRVSGTVRNAPMMTRMPIGTFTRRSTAT